MSPQKHHRITSASELVWRNPFCCCLHAVHSAEPTTAAVKSKGAPPSDSNSGWCFAGAETVHRFDALAGPVKFQQVNICAEFRVCQAIYHSIRSAEETIVMGMACELMCLLLQKSRLLFAVAKLLNISVSTRSCSAVPAFSR